MSGRSYPAGTRRRFDGRLLAGLALTVLLLGSRASLAPVAAQPAGLAPELGDISCTPVPAVVNRAVTCTVPVLAGTVQRWDWGVTNASGIVGATGATATFSFTTSKAGTYDVLLTACGDTTSEVGDPNCAGRVARVVLQAAGCGQWDVSGTWPTTQGNGYHPTFVLQQTGTTITGSASLSPDEAARAGFTATAGAISGTLTGDQLAITVTWAGRSGPVQGHYTATVSQGALTGATGGVSWSGTGPTTCSGTPAGSPPPPTAAAPPGSVPPAAPSTPATAAACAFPDVSGTWSARLADGTTLAFVLQQVEETVSGTASVSAADRDRLGWTATDATVAGAIQRDRLRLVASGPPRQDGQPVVSEYRGRVVDGTISEGTVLDLTAYTSQAWTASGPRGCVAAGTDGADDPDPPPEALPPLDPSDP